MLGSVAPVCLYFVIAPPRVAFASAILIIAWIITDKSIGVNFEKTLLKKPFFRKKRVFFNPKPGLLKAIVPWTKHHCIASVQVLLAVVIAPWVEAPKYSNKEPYLGFPQLGACRPAVPNYNFSPPQTAQLNTVNTKFSFRHWLADSLAYIYLLLFFQKT